MSFIMSFHHRDHLKKLNPSAPKQGPAQNGSTEKPVFIPLSELEFHAKDELKPVSKPAQPHLPDGRFSKPSSYLSEDECKLLKANQHATQEKDRKLAQTAERRSRIINGILGLGIPLLLSCFVGHKKDAKHSDEVPARVVKHTRPQ